MDPPTKRESSSATSWCLWRDNPFRALKMSSLISRQKTSASLSARRLFAGVPFAMCPLLSVSARTEESDMAIAGFGEIAEQLRRSTVLIHAGGRGSGSGVIWSSEGTIVTNAHVVHGSSVLVQLWDGREFDATVTARDQYRDLAALRIDANSLPAASPTDSSQLRPAELAIAIGNPLGCVRALTPGVIHSTAPLRTLSTPTWAQASATLAPGTSG